MLEELAALEELQALDLSTLNIRNELIEIPDNIQEMRQNVTHVGEILAKERARLDESEAWRIERERDISLQTDLLVKSKNKLQGARNEKESNAAQREIDTIRKTIQEREKEAIETMEAIDQYRLRINEHSAEFAELEDLLASTEKEGKERIDEIYAEIKTVESRRSELTAHVPVKTLRLYERIHKRVDKALVEAIDGSCTGCHMNIQPQIYNEIQRCEKMFTCAFCHRILIFKPSKEVDAAEE